MLDGIPILLKRRTLWTPQKLLQVSWSHISASGASVGPLLHTSLDMSDLIDVVREQVGTVQLLWHGFQLVFHAFD
jgi:hypothetical protein